MPHMGFFSRSWTPAAPVKRQVCPISSTSAGTVYPHDRISFTFLDGSPPDWSGFGRVISMEPTPTAVPILRPNVLRAGYSDNEIRRLRRNGTWTSVRRGSYASTGEIVQLDRMQHHELLIRSTIPGLRLPAAVSHVSAAVLLGIPLWSTHLGLVHITRARPANGGRSGSLLCHSAALTEDEVIEVDGIRITSPARTIADLARLLPFEQAVVAADGALFKKLMTRQQLADTVAAISGAPGSRSAARVARFATGLSESVGESRSRVMMHLAGLPEPELQVEVHDAGGRVLGRSDFGWLRGRMLGEFDGKIKYGRLLKPGESAGDVVFKEKIREDALRDNGSRVVRWVWAELAQPTEVIQRIRRAHAATERSLERT